MASKNNDAEKGDSVTAQGTSSPAQVDASIAVASSKLLASPPEVRLQIYDIYFSSPSYGKGFQKTDHFGGYTVGGIDASLMGALMDRFKSAGNGNTTERARSNLNLLSVCRLVHSEAIPRFYHHHLFQFPTYLDLPPGRAATPIKPIMIPLAMTRHFDLIHRVEVVHHHLGDAIADRQNNDLVIAGLLKTISESCPSLRCLTIRVICNLHHELRHFQYRPTGGSVGNRYPTI